MIYLLLLLHTVPAVSITNCCAEWGQGCLSSQNLMSGGKPKYWTALFFTSDRKDFPEQISKVMLFDLDTNENWFVDFKAGNEKYIVFKDRILKYQIGNHNEKEYVCNECRKLGISN